MKVLVCGGRDYGIANPDLKSKQAAQEEIDHLFYILDRLHKTNKITHIIHGWAKGADTLAHGWATKRGIMVTGYAADWEKYGRSAGYKRNVEMAQAGPDLVVAFPGGKGTDNMMKVASDLGIKVLKT